MALGSGDALIAAFPGTPFPFFKMAFTPQSTGQWFSLWAIAGNAGATPSSGVGGDIPTDATAGSLTGSFTNPTPPAVTYLSDMFAVGNQVGTLTLFDRLWHNSGLSATLTSAQTVNSAALTRPDVNGVGAELWLQVYATMGAGTPTITASYTDTAGNTGNTATTVPIVSASTLGRTYPFANAAGDLGVKSVETMTLSATMLSGTYGLVLRRKIRMLSFGVANVGAPAGGPIKLGLPRVEDNACLELVWQCGAASSTTIDGYITTIQG